MQLRLHTLTSEEARPLTPVFNCLKEACEDLSLTLSLGQGPGCRANEKIDESSGLPVCRMVAASASQGFNCSSINIPA